MERSDYEHLQQQKRDSLDSAILGVLERGPRRAELIAKELNYDPHSALVGEALGRLMRKGLIENDRGEFRLVKRD